MKKNLRGSGGGHLTNNLKAALLWKPLVDLRVFMPPTGVICNITGAMYIGSSINIAKRLVQHAVDNDTNVRLQNAINKYGLGNFTFAVVEIFKVDPDVSMETEITKPVY